MKIRIRFSIAVIAAASTLFGACQSDSGKTTSGTVDTTQKTSTAASETPRNRQIAALRLLRDQLADTSGAAFSEVFDFPIPEDRFYPYVEQESFRSEYEKAGRKLTKALFLKHFPEISRSLELAEFRELLTRQLPPERLETSDSVHAIKQIPNEECHRYYMLQIMGEELSIQYGSDHGPDAPATEEGDGTVCEWATIWTFRFDGKTWRFVNMQQAG